MSENPSITHQPSFSVTKYIFIFFSTLIPGSSLLLTNKGKLAFWVPFWGVLWVLCFSYTRWVITPNGFMVMLIGLLCMHLLSFLFGILKQSKTPNKYITKKHFLYLSLLFLLNVSIVISCHLYKDKWFGFAFYHIPSVSMSPTLQMGDVVLIDTWAYQNNSPEINDIIIVKRTSKSLVLAKRVTKTRKDGQLVELFIEGDNQHRSVDSRKFGWISDKFIIGKVEFIWFSFNSEQRHLMSTI